MRDLIVFCLVFGFLPFAVFRPSVGILLWNWIGLMNPHRLGWGFAYHFKFAHMIGLVTLFSFIFSKERKKIPLTPLVCALLFFVFWMSVTTYTALVPEDAVHQWEKVMKVQLFIFLAISVMQSKQKIHAYLWVVVFSVAYFGIKGGIFTVLNGGSHRVLGPPGSQIADNNTLALALIMVVPLILYLSRQVKNIWFKKVLVLCTFLCIFSIIGSHSRGALLALCAMGFLLVLKSRYKVIVLGSILVLAPVLVQFMPQAWMDRMKTIQTYQEDASAMGRLNAWNFAYNLAKERPFVGGGFETFRPHLFYQFAPEPERYHDSHSIYFEVLGEQGFMGLFIFLSIIGLSWRTCSKIRRTTAHVPELAWAHDLSSMLQSSMMGYMIGGAFLGVAYFDLFYTLVAFLVLTQLEVNKVLKPIPSVQPQLSPISALKEA